MAAAPWPFPYPSAATYPPPFSGGCYPSPFSSYPAPASGFFPGPSYGAPPAFPCAATYPYPPPASACTVDAGTAATGFFPAPAFPYAAPFPYPPSPPGFFQAPAPATGTSAQPWVSLSTNTAATAPVRRPDRVPSAPIPCGSSSTSSRLLDTVRTPPNRERTPLQSSFDSLHGELSKLSALVSQFAVVMGLQTTEALVTDSSSLVASAQFRSPATTASVPSLFCVAASSFVSSPSSPLRASFIEPAAMIASTTAANASMLPAAPAYVASQVFDKMATPSTGHGTQATTPNYCDGHQTPIQSTSVPAGNDKLSEQNLDEMPQSYGFNNLSRQSLFLADSTERSYYVVPEDYPLEQATKPMSPPAEKHVGVMVPPSVAAHAADVAPVLGFKANNTAGYESLLVPNLQLSMKVQDAPNVFKGMPVYDIYEEEDSGCLNITSDVRDFSTELQQQEDEKACNCPVLKASDSVITSSNQLGSEHSMRELRLLWDPGASAIPANHLNNDNNNDTIGMFNEAVLHIPPAKPPERYDSADSSPVNVQLKTPPLNVLVTRERREQWDPGDYTSLSSRLNRDILGVLSCLSQQIYCKVPPSQYNRVLQFEWDPGILSFIDMMLGKTVVPNRIHSRQTPCTLLILLGQPVNLNQFWAQLVTCLPWCHIPNAFLEVQYCCLPFVLDCSYSEPIPQLVCYTRMFSSTEAILSALCMSTASTLFMILVLSFEEIAEEGKDGTAVYQVSKIQLPMRQISHAWDPGIKSILVFYKGLHTQMIHLVHCSTIHACDLAPAHLPPKQISAYCPSNIGFVHEQGVQKNYNANNLLSSQKYLQIVELDIIFITFLPP